MRNEVQTHSGVSILDQIADALGETLHSYSAASEYEATLDKKRTLVRYTPRDELVVKALSLDLKNRVEAKLSPSVMAYREGYGPQRAIQELTRYLRRERKKALSQGEAHPKFYLLRRDIEQYTDSIPLQETSPLWARLKSLDLSPVFFENLKNALRVSLLSQNKVEFCRLRGIPMGSHLTPRIANLYLTRFDDWIRSIDSTALYLRYGDDLIWIGRNLETALRLQRQIPEELKKDGLSENTPKSKNIILCSNGRASEPNADWSSRSQFTYLGRELTWSGHVSISPDRRRDFLHEARIRLQSIQNLGLDRKAALSMAFQVFHDVTLMSWRNTPELAMQIREVNHPGTLRSLRVDFLREIARVFERNTSSYAIRRLKK